MSYMIFRYYYWAVDGLLYRCICERWLWARF